MEGFTYDSAYYPNTPIEMAFSNNFPSCFHNYCSSSEATPEASAAHDAFSYDSSSSLNNGSRAPAVSLANKHHLSMEKKRKNLNGTSKESKGSNKSRRQKKSSGGLKGTEENPTEEPPAGYIHVRARRGQATDSHSLAERVRRERISERMKMLQGLVPGCERVAGKALVLDEIINYVQSLQNQVEFLSMRLASQNPMVYGLGEAFDNSMNQQESIIQAIPSGFQPNIEIPPIAFGNATNDYPMMQEPTTFSQDNESFLVQVGDSRQQGFFDQVEFNNMCAFH